MSKIDKQKEIIGYMKVIFGILIAIDVSLVAWIFKHSDMLYGLQALVVLSVVLLVTTGLLYTNKSILKKIDEIEEM